jgi:hypothetical protein
MKILLLAMLISIAIGLKSQTVIAFYNLENFYDTVDNPITIDEEFTPGGLKKYGKAIYTDKIFHLATVLSCIGWQYDANGPVLIGVAEIENDTVLQDLRNHFLLRERKYQFIHFDSRDARGVDVALFYKPHKFTPLFSDKLAVALPGGAKEAAFTRDILYVKGLLGKDTLHVFVNHWPSRRGGEERSAPAREAAAAVCRKAMDSIQLFSPNASIIVMGDLNDNPSDKSIRKILRSTGVRDKVEGNMLFNPWVDFLRMGVGTLAHNDTWGLFDQILVSQPMTDTITQGWKFDQAFIFYRPYLTETAGKYRGYPKRTWEGNTYNGGFSDHFPTYIVLKRAK